MKARKVAAMCVCVVGTLFLGVLTLTAQRGSGPTEAPAAFDNLTNGFVTQAEFDDGLDAFADVETIEDGLGPVFNAQGCAQCHQNPIVGGGSQVSELRAGHLNRAGEFVDAPGGSLINDRAIDARIQERVSDAERVRTFRMSLSILGLGFVEAIDSSTLVAIARNQADQTRGRIAGEVIRVPVAEAPGAMRVGRFGWKNQNASLLSFAGDAYVNEMGITNRLFMVENTSLGRSVAAFDGVPDPDDVDNDVDAFAAFMRATKAPPRDAALSARSDALAGSVLFNQVGCNVCHVRSITTAPVGTVINGGDLTIPAALGNKVVHPFGDFLLHDVGTGDGIVQNGGQGTANKLRTAPLWGVRTKSRLMHDGLSVTFTDAILRHGGEAAATSQAFRSLPAVQRNQLVRFLESL
ncbi:MAG: di-heme oxidoredictase family protein [Vicinamibacterales bacterium]